MNQQQQQSIHIITSCAYGKNAVVVIDPRCFQRIVPQRLEYEDGVHRCAPFPSSILVSFGRVAARERQGALSCRGEPGSALSGGDAPDSAKAEGSSIVDEPREG